LGNDFLPHIPSLDIHKNGIEYLITNYAKTINEFIIERNKVKYLLKNITSSSVSKILNINFLRSFINKLSLLEENVLKDNYTKGRRKLRIEGDEYEREIFKIENLLFRIDDPIQLGSDSVEEWRKRYYNHYYGVEDGLEEFVENLVKNYLIGIKWVSLYYFEDCPSWEWYYPLEHPPFISDIYKYFDSFNFNDYKFKKGKALEPVQQLLCVLPPQSSYLLPLKFRKLMTNVNSSLAYLYPIKFEQDFINKTKYWMGIPNLPPLDIELVRHIYNKYNDE
jgi:5'-3' exonuclease